MQQSTETTEYANKVVYIRPSQKFYGKYEVVTPQGVIPCHNYATARTIVREKREQ